MEEFSFTVTDIFWYVYNLLLDSGFRLVEAVKLMGEIGEVESVNGFYRCRLGYFRETKQAYFAYLTGYTLSLVREARREPLKEYGISHYFSKYGYVGPKYVWKFVFDKMIELEVPWSVADSIEGKVPRHIGAKHYMALMRQADRFCGKYAEYVTSLRRKAGLESAQLTTHKG